jgi:hypothetical protein
MGTPRDPALTLVLILLTCGFYYLYFIYVVSQETQDFLEEPDISPGVEVLLSVLTCGLWNIYWDYRMGKRIAEMSVRVGLPPTDNAVLYLLLDLVGAGGFLSLGLINPVLQQDGLNRVWKAAQDDLPRGPVPGSWPPSPNPSSIDSDLRTPRQPRPPRS